MAVIKKESTDKQKTKVSRKCTAKSMESRREKYVIADLRAKLSAACQERDDRTKQLQTWETFANGLKEKVINLQTTIEQKDNDIKTLLMQTNNDRVRIEGHSEEIAQLIQAKENKIESLEQVTNSERERVDREISDLRADQESFVMEVNEERKYQDEEVEDLKKKVKVYKRRIVQLKKLDMKRVHEVLEDFDRLHRDEYEKEKNELLLEIKSKQRAVELLVGKLNDVAVEDEHFRKTWEAIYLSL